MPSVWTSIHSSDEMRQASTNAHRLVGVIFALIAVLLFVEIAIGMGVLSGAKAAVLLFAGGFLPMYLLIRHGFEHVASSMKILTEDRQQQQMLMIALWLFVAGIVEALIAAHILTTSFELILPFVIASTSVTFLFVLPNDEPAAVQAWKQKHLVIGLVGLLCAAVGFAGVLFDSAIGHGVFALTLIVFAALLVFYREPESMYATSYGL